MSERATFLARPFRYGVRVSGPSCRGSPACVRSGRKLRPEVGVGRARQPLVGEHPDARMLEEIVGRVPEVAHDEKIRREEEPGPLGPPGMEEHDVSWRPAAASVPATAR
jgi:hypothetical protein